MSLRIFWRGPNNRQLPDGQRSQNPFVSGAELVRIPQSAIHRVPMPADFFRQLTGSESVQSADASEIFRIDFVAHLNLASEYLHCVGELSQQKSCVSEYLNHPLNQEFARLLLKSGWSQREAAERLHRGAPAISQYLSGVTKPDVLVIQHFKLLIGDKMPLPGASGPIEMREYAPEDPDLEEIVQILKLMPAEDRKRIVFAIKTLLVGHSPKPVKYTKQR